MADKLDTKNDTIPYLPIISCVHLPWLMNPAYHIDDPLDDLMDDPPGELLDTFENLNSETVSKVDQAETRSRMLKLELVRQKSENEKLKGEHQKLKEKLKRENLRLGEENKRLEELLEKLGIENGELRDKNLSLELENMNLQEKYDAR